MTGNNKVWRAPVAGLAAVAMLATLGVSAMTANAADASGNPQVILDANYGNFGDKSVKTVTKSGNDWVDELYGTTPKRQSMHGNYTFTGWYLSPNAGEAVNPYGDIADGTRLYAHWAAGAGTTITFANVNDTVEENTHTTGNSSNVVTANSALLADGDTLADWQMPSEDRAGDHQLFTGKWTIDGNTYTPVTEDAVTVTLKATDVKWTVNDGVELDNDDLAQLQGTTGLKKDYPKGATVSLPQVYSGTASSWYRSTPTVNEEAVDGDSYQLGSATSDLTVNYTNNTTGQQYVFLRTVSVKTTVANPADAYVKNVDQIVAVTKGWRPGNVFKDPVKVGAEFEGWYTASDFANKFDFNVALNNDSYAYAKFVADPTAPKTIKFTFDLNYDNSTPIVVDATVGGYVDLPSDPVREGYTFKGWSAYQNDYSTNNQINHPFPFVTDPVSDSLSTTVYYAQWVENKAETPQEKLTTQATSYPFTGTAWKVGNDADFTEDSLIAFKRAVNSMKVTDISALSDDEASALYDQLVAAEAKLVQTKAATENAFRSYNPNDGDHVYTWRGEALLLSNLGWTAEGKRFAAVKGDKAIPNVSEAVYRVYDPNAGEHLNVGYEEGATLVAQGWSWDDGDTDTPEVDPMFYVPLGSEGVELYRVYNPFATNAGRHMYADKAECAKLVGLGYVWDNDGESVYTFNPAE